MFRTLKDYQHEFNCYKQKNLIFPHNINDNNKSRNNFS